MSAEILSSDLKEIAELFFVTENPAKAQGLIRRTKSTDFKDSSHSWPSVALNEVKSQPVERLASLCINDEEERRAPLLEKLLSFLSPRTDLNPVLVGYFTKVLGSIIDTRRNDAWKYFVHHREHLENLIYFSSLEPIADVLAKLLRDGYGEVSDISFPKKRREILDSLLKIPDKGWNVICLLIPSKVEITYLLSKRVVKEIYGEITKQSNGVLETGLKLLTYLIETSTVPEIPFSPFEPFHKETNNESMDITSIIKHAAIHMDFFKAELCKLYNEPENSLGSTKLAIIDFLFSLAKLKREEIFQAFSNCKLIGTLLDLMGKHSTHSILHLRVYKIISEILSSNNLSWVEIVIKESGIACKLLELFKEGRKGFVFKDKKKQLNKQYIVFVTQLCGTLNNLARKSMEVSRHFEEVVGWKEFSANELREIQYKENTRIGDGYIRTRRSFGLGMIHQVENKAVEEECENKNGARKGIEVFGKAGEEDNAKKAKNEGESVVVSEEIVILPQIEKKASNYTS